MARIKELFHGWSEAGLACFTPLVADAPGFATPRHTATWTPLHQFDASRVSTLWLMRSYATPASRKGLLVGGSSSGPELADNVKQHLEKLQQERMGRLHQVVPVDLAGQMITAVGLWRSPHTRAAQSIALEEKAFNLGPAVQNDGLRSLALGPWEGRRIWPVKGVDKHAGGKTASLRENFALFRYLVNPWVETSYGASVETIPVAHKRIVHALGSIATQLLAKANQHDSAAAIGIAATHADVMQIVRAYFFDGLKPFVSTAPGLPLFQQYVQHGALLPIPVYRTAHGEVGIVMPYDEVKNRPVYAPLVAAPEELR